LASREDTFSTSKAILFLDLAVEQMMRAIISSLNPNKHYKNDPNWHQLWSDAEAALHAKGFQLHNHYALKNLHEHRNMIQHIGATYHFSQARNHVVPVEDMLSRAFSDVYNLDFSRYNFSALIANKDLRRWLQDAEQLLSEGNALMAIAACQYAHRIVIDAMRRRSSISRRLRLTLHDPDSSDIASLAETLDELHQRFVEEIEALEIEVVAIGVGVSIFQVRQFRSLSSLVGVSIYEDGQMSVNFWEDESEEHARAAKFMLDYLSRLIRLTEQSDPDALKELRIQVPLMRQEAVEALRAGGEK
jgi:hypothetical protein